MSQRDDDIASIKRDITLMKWMLGVLIAFNIAIIIKVFSHA